MSTIESLRQFRLGSYTIFDLAISYLGIFLLIPILNKIIAKLNLTASKTTWLLLTLPIGIITHLLFNQQTQMVKDFINPSNHYFIKVLIFTMLYFGLKGFKKR